MNNVTGTFTVTNATTLNNSSGIEITSSATATFSFGSLGVTTTAGAALNAANAGTVMVGGTTNTLTAVGGPALVLSNTAIGSGMTFNSISSTGSPTTGIDINGITGTGGLLVNNTTTITNPDTTAVLVQNSNIASGVTSFDFGSTTVQDTVVGVAPNANGIDLLTGNSGSTFTFDTLAVTTDGGFGLAANNSGTVNLKAAGSINATGGPAVNLTNTTGQLNGVAGWSFSNLTSTNSTSDGVRLMMIGDSVSVTTADINAPTMNGIDIRNSSGNVTFSTLEVQDPGSGNAQDASAGIFLDTNTGSFTTNGGFIDFSADNDDFGVFASDVADVTIQGVSGNLFDITDVGRGTNDDATINTAGVSIENASDVILNFLSILRIGENGTAGVAEDDGIRLTNIADSISVTNSTLGEYPLGDGLDIVNSAEAMTGRVRIGVTAAGVAAPNTFGPVTAGFQDGHRAINIIVSNVNSTLEAFIQNNSIQNQGNFTVGSGSGIQILVDGEAGTNGAGGGTPVRATISDNTISDRAGDNILIDALTGGALNVLIEDNTLTATAGPTGSGERESAIQVSALGESVAPMRQAILNATIRNNSITGFEGAGIFEPILIQLNGNSPAAAMLNVLVDDHTIANAGNEAVRLRCSSDGVMNGIVSNNSLAGSLGLQLELTGSSTTTVNLNVFDNDSPLFRIDSGDVADDVDLGCLPPCPVASVTNTAQLQSLLDHNDADTSGLGNTTGGAGGASINVQIDGGIGAFDVIDSTTVTVPTLPPAF